MRIFKRVYCTLAKKSHAIDKVPDIISLQLVQYLPTFDYVYNPPLFAYG